MSHNFKALRGKFDPIFQPWCSHLNRRYAAFSGGSGGGLLKIRAPLFAYLRTALLLDTWLGFGPES